MTGSIRSVLFLYYKFGDFIEKEKSGEKGGSEVENVSNLKKEVQVILMRKKREVRSKQ